MAVRLYHPVTPRLTILARQRLLAVVRASATQCAAAARIGHRLPYRGTVGGGRPSERVEDLMVGARHVREGFGHQPRSIS